MQHRVKIGGSGQNLNRFFVYLKKLFSTICSELQFAKKFIIINAIVSIVFRKFIFPLGSRQLPGQRMRLCVDFL